MNRREFLKTLSLGIIAYGAPFNALVHASGPEDLDDYISDGLFTLSGIDKPQPDDIKKVWEYMFGMSSFDKPYVQGEIDVKHYMAKMKNFDKPHLDDVIIGESEYSTFESTFKRIRRVQRFVGHGHFQVLSLDDAIKIARNSSRVERFSQDELNFMENIFYKEASSYGFFGKKPITEITGKIKKKEVVKVPYTGNYIYKGIPMEMYQKIKKQVGKKVILTSGIRGVMKQFYLFLNKVRKNGGNLSLASRSLAPPGYSFHGKGDFDVGQVGFGVSNFTTRFTTTKVYKQLCDLGYLKLRYPRENYLGVRYEPWHIKTNQV
jgi:hypothetical protein